jgi:hypothetical protein
VRSTTPTVCIHPFESSTIFRCERTRPRVAARAALHDDACKLLFAHRLAERRAFANICGVCQSPYSFERIDTLGKQEYGRNFLGTLTEE